MDDFILKVGIPEYSFGFDHSSRFLFMGSCFAEHIGQRLSDLRYKVNINPNGILYHPLNMADVLEHAIQGKSYTHSDLLNRADIILSWQHHGSIYGSGEDAFLEVLNKQASDLRSQLKSIDTLVLTFGTAYHWVLKEGERRVVNCHKQASDLFEKRLSSTKELVQVYTSLIDALQAVHPDINILLTVSPVRYKRDGIIENNRSKARLLLLCEHLEEQFESVRYFPAYELLIDSLRDYRFYGRDLVHPSEAAVDYIWQQFSRVCFTPEYRSLSKRIAAFNKSAAHRPLYPESSSSMKFAATLADQKRDLDQLLSKY